MTGLLTTCGAQFRDWTSRYRRFSHDRLPVAAIFSVVRRAVLAELPPHAPLCTVLDDTLLPRSGLRTPGAHQELQLIVLAPLGYRSRKGSKLLYRRPAFLICTDENLDPPIVIQTYFPRWGIEVNVRDEKTLLGVGQAQVRCPRSVESAPALTVASYALLLLATQRAFADSRPPLLPRPQWMPASPSTPISTQQALHQLRAEVWGLGLGLDNSSGFAATLTTATKPEKFSFPLASAVCYANA